MKQVIELDETLAGEVIQIKDDYAVGPLTGLIPKKAGRQDILVDELAGKFSLCGNNQLENLMTGKQ